MDISNLLKVRVEVGLENTLHKSNKVFFMLKLLPS